MPDISPAEVLCFSDLEQELERLRLFVQRVEEAATDSATAP